MYSAIEQKIECEQLITDKLRMLYSNSHIMYTAECEKSEKIK